jgi:hypothetical protein
MNNTLTLYPQPDGVAASPDYVVRVNGRDSFVYACAVASYTMFSFDAADGFVTVEITPRVAPTQTIVRPLARGIIPVEEGGALRFDLAAPQKLSVEVGGLPPLYLFASEPETDKPDPNNPDVRYFAAGRVYDFDNEMIPLSSDQTVYIEGGAVVRGAAIRAVGSENVTVRGRGILDGTPFPSGSMRLVVFEDCRDVLVEGIVSVGTPCWNVVFGACDRVRVDGIHLIGWTVTGDGVDVVGSENVHITNCFLRCNDDCVAIKAVTYPMPAEARAMEKAGTRSQVDWRRDVRHVLVEKCVLYNDRAGNALEIGFETQTDVIEKIVFRDCDVIAAHGYGGVFTIHNGDRAVIRDVLYEDIRVEHFYDLLVDFRILHSRYSKDATRGSIENVTLCGIRAVPDPFNTVSLIGGFDAEHNIRDVVFEEFHVGDTHITDADALHLFTKHAENITYR